MLDVLTNGGWEQMRWERLAALNPDEGGWSMRVVDVSRLARDEVAAAVLDWARAALAGAAPLIQVPTLARPNSPPPDFLSPVAYPDSPKKSRLDSSMTSKCGVVESSSEWWWR
jgi:hypothetical protein